jgi:phasin family protein
MAEAPEQKGGMSFPGLPDFTAMLSRMQLPAMPDMEAVLAAHRRNLEVLTAANKVALEGAQAVARRNAEIVQQTMSEFADTVRAMTAAEGPQAKAAKQAELLKVAYQRAVANLKEVGDLIQRSNSEAMGLLSARFTEALDEVKALAERHSA